MSMAKNNWNRDLKIKITGENENDIVGKVLIHGVEGEADEQITLDEIKACAKYFSGHIGNIVEMIDDDEYAMAYFLALRAETMQRGGTLEVNILDTIPIMQKWLTKEALVYLHDKMTEKLKEGDEVAE